MSEPPAVSFVLAGVQKAGTSSLWAMLEQHPQLARPERKELHYFDRDGRDWSRPDHQRYESRFAWGEGAVAAGEATPAYVFWPGAMERVRDYNPAMRVVLSVRDPVERAFSQWCMERLRTPDELPDFAEAIRKDPPARWPRTAAEAGVASRAFVGRGYYDDQLARTAELFPAEQVLVLDYHTIFRDLAATMDRITDFLGLDRFAAPPAESRRRVQTTRIRAQRPTGEDVRLLAGLYADDLGRFAARTGLDLAHWPTVRVLAGQLGADELAETMATKADVRPAGDRRALRAAELAAREEALREERRTARRKARKALRRASRTAAVTATAAGSTADGEPAGRSADEGGSPDSA